MFRYKMNLGKEVTIDRPDFQNYLLLDKELQGTLLGMHTAMQYIRDSFMMNNDDFRFMYVQMGINTLNHMEVLSTLIHQMHGSDDRYYDEDNDDTPTHELIPPLEKEPSIKVQEPAHINNDITACTMFHLQEENRQIAIYQEIIAKLHDQGAEDVLHYIMKGKQKNIKILKDILNTLKEPNEIKDFGLDATSFNAFSANSGNYFDKPNPEFLNAREQKTLSNKHL